jgi:FtsZ-binding cell division protein ZapB
MRAEPSNYERVQMLRTPQAAAGPVIRPIGAAAYEDDAADVDDAKASVRGGFFRLAAFVLVMAAFGSGLAVAWRATEPTLLAWIQDGPALAAEAEPGTEAAAQSAPNQVAAAPAVTGQVPTPNNQTAADPLARIARELDSLKIAVGAMSSAQQQMAASIAALQSAQQQLHAAQQELQNRLAAMPAAAAGPTAYSNALSAIAIPPQSAAPSARAVQAPRAAVPAAPAAPIARQSGVSAPPRP